MADEPQDEKPKSKKEETALSFLEQAKAEREALDKTKEEVTKLLEEFKQITAVDILSGRVTQPKPELKKEIPPQDYVDMVMRGIIPEQQK